MTKTAEQLYKEYEIASLSRGFSYDKILDIINSKNSSNEERAAAITILEKKAESWIADAQYFLSLYYRDNKKDSVTAADWCISAAYLGHHRAQLHLAALYQNKDGVNQDFEMANFWINVASKKPQQNTPQRIFEFIREEQETQRLKKAYYTEQGEENLIPLAERHEAGKGAIKSEELALKYYEESTYSLAQFRRGRYYIKSEDREQHQIAFEIFEESCDDESLSAEDRAEAKLQMAICYEHGKGIKKDELKASDCYMDAAYAESLEAQLYLINAYQKGDKKGLDKNYKKALYWSKVIAQTHYKDNPIIAGNNYENLAKNIAEDIAKSPSDENLAEKKEQLLLSRRRAKYWYNLANEQGQQEAKEKLANYTDCNIDEDGAFREPPPLDEYFAQECKKNARSGNQEALMELAIRYETGNGVVKNPAQAQDIRESISDLDPLSIIQKRAVENLAQQQSDSKRTHEL